MNVLEGSSVNSAANTATGDGLGNSLLIAAGCNTSENRAP
jgi:hypothetical protein